MSIKLGTTDIAGLTTKTKYNAHTLLDFKWSDHILNDISWLRADTFSWQNGNTYTAVYNYLVNSIQGATQTTDQGITFYECTNGLRIALADQENNVLSAYNTDGVAWYYILDTANTRFKLPRTKYGFVGLRDGAGGYVPQDIKLPNIKGTLSANAWAPGTTSNSGPFYSVSTTTYSVSSGTSNQHGLGFDASRSSSIYSGDGTNTNIQQKSTQMYLYFYVGEFSQTAIEQTAGLNAELFNGKVDLNLSNVSNTDMLNKFRASGQIYLKTTYVSGTSGYNIWSNGYCEQWGVSSNVEAGASFLKNFKDTNYNINAISKNANFYARIMSKSTNKMVLRLGTAYGSSETYEWKVSGYLADGQY